MAAQPANTDIKVYRTIRTFRQGVRQESVAALTKRLRPMVMSIPANEVLVGTLTRDTNSKDFSSFMGQASAAASRGFPVVVGLKGAVSFAAAQTNLPAIDFAFQIGQDKFLTNTAAGLTNDLHEDARDLATDL
jgi:hypothetical protein